MLRTLDRYIIRETLPPFGLTLLILTFLLQIPTIIEYAEKLIAKGVSLPVIGEIHLPSGSVFDLGVFAVVVGSTLSILMALAHQSLRARRQTVVVPATEGGV